MAKLVILESPGKINKVQKILGNDYDVMASYGHVLDLPEKGIGVDIKHGFDTVFEVKKDKLQVLNEIKGHAKKASAVYLMMDGDREGHGIAFNLYEQLKTVVDEHKIKRSVTFEITESGVSKAIENAGPIDMDMVESYLTRRILDRLAGYKTSFLTRQSTGGISAGRVQSAILRIIVDREKEISNFIPEEYWVLTATFRSPDNQSYTGILDESIKVPNEASATKIYDAVMQSKKVFVKSAETKTHTVNPLAPFTAVSMVSSASSCFGWTAAKTMKIAQTLYEKGLCTYHRSDSTYMASEAVSDIRSFINNVHGSAYLPHDPPVFKSAKGSQEAHEACRVTNVQNEDPGLSGQDAKLYEMIWRRTVASQMKAGQDAKTKVVTTATYDFISHGSTVIFDGFRKVWTYGKIENSTLPNVKADDVCTIKSLDKDQKFTSPPPRYSDGSLAKKCESEQIIRPSTIARYFDLLADRGYVKRTNKSFSATEMGIRVIDFLVAANMCFVDTKFTAGLEEQLDRIQSKHLKRLDVLTEFWTRLKSDIENGQNVKKSKQVTEFKCPKCGGHLLQKYSVYGAFFSCVNYKSKETPCDYIASSGPDGTPVEKKPVVKEYATFPCVKCGGKMVKRTSKKGNQFYGCENFVKGCRSAADLDGNFNANKPKPKWQKWTKKGKNSEP